MAKSEQRQKDQARAAYLIRMGYPHGRRMSVGLSAYPVNEPGSAAYRRLMTKRRAQHDPQRMGGRK